MSDTAHQEKHFENYIVTKLAEQGWLVWITCSLRPWPINRSEPQAIQTVGAFEISAVMW